MERSCDPVGMQEDGMKCVLPGERESVQTIEDKISWWAEMKYLREFARQNCFDREITREQFCCLWTAYCIHYGLVVDTLGYDKDLSALWDILVERGPETEGWKDYDSFDNFMCKCLV